MLQGLHVLNKRLHPWQFKGNALDICYFHTYSYPVVQILQLQAMTLFHCNRRFCFENHYWFPTYCTNIITHTICVPLFNYAMPNVKKYQWKPDENIRNINIRFVSLMNFWIFTESRHMPFLWPCPGRPWHWRWRCSCVAALTPWGLFLHRCHGCVCLQWTKCVICQMHVKAITSHTKI